MNKIRWRMLVAIGLLLSLIPLTTTGPVWASAPQEPTSAVNLLLQDQEAPQVIQSAPIQSIVNLLLQDDDEAEKGTQVFLPLVLR